jgi:hypothetical protein
MAQWLAACLVADPLLRPTPQQALALPFRDQVADEVDAAIAAAMPSYIAGNQAIVQLLQGLQGQDDTFVAQQQQAPSATSNSNGRDGCSAVAASHTAQQAVAVPAADIRPQEVVCGSSSSSSSSIDVSTEASSSSCGVDQQQQQQPPAELVVRAAAEGDGSMQTEQEQQSEVQGLQLQDFTCVAHEQQVPSPTTTSSSRDGFSAVAASHTAQQAVAVPTPHFRPQDVVCGSSSSNSNSSNGSSPLPPDTPSDLNSRLSDSSVGVGGSESLCPPAGKSPNSGMAAVF